MNYEQSKNLRLAPVARAAILFAMALFFISGPRVVLGQSSKVNPALRKFHQRFENPSLTQVGPRVHAAFGFDFSNFGMIEGVDGVIIIDTGWFPGSVRPAWNSFRKLSKKPVKAIIYTHMHGDHIGGASVFQAEADDSLVVYAPVGWKEHLEHSFTSQFHLVYRRAYAQMGLLLPKSDNGTVGAGIGPAPRPNGIPSLVSPTEDVTEKRELEIAGVRIHLIPSPGDISSHMMVWLPDDKVLFCGDILGGTLPFIATPRYEPSRVPRGFVSSLELAMSLPAEKVVPGHGRLLLDRDDAQDVFQVNIDVIRFLTDQVERYITQGYSADQVIDILKLPALFAEHPDLQPHYHRLDWLIRGLALTQAGFMGDVMDLCKLTDAEESKRMIELLGGSAKTVAHAQKALSADDPRWAASLASHVLRVEPQQAEAKEVRVAAFRQIAYATDSANERNYLLTAAKEEDKGIRWNATLAVAGLVAAKERSSQELISDMSVRFRADESAGDDFVLKINIEGESDPHYLASRSYTLFYRPDVSTNVDSEITLSRVTLNGIWAKGTTWSESLAQGKIRANRNAESASRILQLIE